MSVAVSLTQHNHEGMSRSMASVEELWKRRNDAGVRFVKTEIDVASSMMARIQRLSNHKERANCVKEVRAAIATASRFAQCIEFPEGEEQEVAKRIEELSEELERAAGMGVKTGRG